MSIKPVLKLMKNNQLLALTASNALLKPFYQLNYLVAAKECGLFDLLLDAPKSSEQLAQVYCKDNKAREALEAWLSLGVRLGYLGLDGIRTQGAGQKTGVAPERRANRLATGSGGTACQLDLTDRQETSQREHWDLEDQDGEIIARSSRVMETFQAAAIDRFFPASGAASLLSRLWFRSLHQVRCGQKSVPDSRRFGVAAECR